MSGEAVEVLIYSVLTYLTLTPPSTTVIAKAQYALKITFIFVAVLFIDAVQRMVKVTAEGETMRDNTGMRDARTESNFHARKFYAQRNTYLTGFTLFLSLILSRTYSLITELISTQEELVSAKKGQAPGASATASAGGSAEAEKLRVQLDNLKKQSDQQQKEYNRLADELAAAKGQKPSTRSD